MDLAPGQTNETDWGIEYPGLQHPLNIHNSGWKYVYNIHYDDPTQTASYTVDAFSWTCGSTAHKGYAEIWECNLKLGFRKKSQYWGTPPGIWEGGIISANALLNDSFGAFSLPYSTVINSGNLNFISTIT